MTNSTVISEKIFGYIMHNYYPIIGEDTAELVQSLEKCRVPSKHANRIIAQDRLRIERRGFSMEDYAFYPNRDFPKTLQQCLANVNELTISEAIWAYYWNKKIWFEKRDRLKNMIEYDIDLQKAVRIHKSDDADGQEWGKLEESTTTFHQALAFEEISLQVQTQYVRLLEQNLHQLFGVSSKCSISYLQLLRVIALEMKKDDLFQSRISAIFKTYRDTTKDIYSKEDYQKMKSLF